jgi:unsaturated chondroitin disaccharide hydrolase
MKDKLQEMFDGRSASRISIGWIRVLRHAFPFFLMYLFTGLIGAQEVSTVDDINLIIGKVEMQYQGMMGNIPDFAKYPLTTNEDGTLQLVNPGNWTSGFFPGSLWLLYEFTGKDFWLNNAIQFTAGIEGQKYNTGTHDLGFMLGCSFGNGYRLTDDPAYEGILVQAATSLAGRYNSNVGCIRSWDFGSWEFPVIVDNMMNLELLFLATRLTGDSSYWGKAVSHADVTMINHYRDDYSSWHVVDYNPATGDTIAKYTHQGYSASSAWSRGQSWGLYGYTMCYRITGDERYLEMAENIALFLIGHDRMPADLVPYWDYDAPGIPNEPRDVAAAAIMCSALFELSRYSESHGTAFLNTAIDQINSISTDAYTAAPDSNNHFILMHATGNYPANSGVDVPMNYADYYYLEALTRYRRHLNEPPRAGFTYEQTDSITRLQVDFDASSTVDPDNDSLVYLWDFGDDHKKYSPAETTSHVYESPGNYSVTLYVSDKWGGVDTIVQTVMVTPLVNVLWMEEPAVSVYPNPVSDGFVLELPGWRAVIHAFLVHATGKKFPFEIHSGKTRISTSGLESGYYLLVVPGYEESITKKILIIKQ